MANLASEVFGIPATTFYSFSRNQILPLLTDALLQIETGVVRTVTWNEEGEMITLGYWGVQDVVGQPLSQIEPYEIHCLTDVQIRLLPKPLWQQVSDAIVKQVRQLEELLSIANCNYGAQRLWLFLTFLEQKFGQNIAQGRLIDLRLTHQQLAEATNLTRVTVTRTLQQFETEGKLLRLSRQRLILKTHHQATGRTKQPSKR